jgi:hypothetical protein
MGSGEDRCGYRYTDGTQSVCRLPRSLHPSEFIHPNDAHVFIEAEPIPAPQEGGGGAVAPESLVRAISDNVWQDYGKDENYWGALKSAVRNGYRAGFEAGLAARAQGKEGTK